MTGPNARSTTTPWRRSSSNKAYYTGGNPWTTSARPPSTGFERTERRQFSAHTVASYTLDLRLFFAEVSVPLAQVSFREVDQFVERQHHRPGLGDDQPAAQCAEALFCLLPGAAAGTRNPKPSHFVRRGRPCPKPSPASRSNGSLPRSPIRWTRAVSRDPPLWPGSLEVADLKLEQIDWEQQALHIVQGKGRKDRRVYMSPDAWPVSNSAWSSIRASGRRAMSFGIANASSSPCR